MRREYLKNQEENKYQETISKFLATQKNVNQQLMNVFVSKSGIEPDLINRSG